MPRANPKANKRPRASGTTSPASTSRMASGLRAMSLIHLAHKRSVIFNRDGCILTPNPGLFRFGACGYKFGRLVTGKREDHVNDIRWAEFSCSLQVPKDIGFIVT